MRDLFLRKRKDGHSGIDAEIRMNYGKTAFSRTAPSSRTPHRLPALDAGSSCKVRGIDAELPYELRKDGFFPHRRRIPARRTVFPQPHRFPHLMRDLFLRKGKDGPSGIDAEIPYERRKDGFFPAPLPN